MSTSQKQPCITCNKAAGIFRCYGCQNDYCTRHSTEHRQILGKKLDEATVQHDQLKQIFNEQIHQHRSYLGVKQMIDDWEIESTKRIHEMADFTRKQVDETKIEQVDNLRQSLERLREEMIKARVEDDFTEIDLKKWMDTLNELKQELITPREVCVEFDKDQTSFISKIFIREPDSTDVFEQTAGNISILENGKVVLNGMLHEFATVRCRNSYDKGLHRIRFKIKQFNSSKWNCFGIISKCTDIAPMSYHVATFYGWDPDGHVILNGVGIQGWRNYQGGIKTDDIIVLEVDCDNRKIRWNNVRTDHRHTIDVDTHLCKFPWQINICLLGPGDRIQMLEN